MDQVRIWLGLLGLILVRFGWAARCSAADRSDKERTSDSLPGVSGKVAIQLGHSARSGILHRGRVRRDRLLPQIVLMQRLGQDELVTGSANPFIPKQPCGVD
jgi:hypothetical protein